MSGVLYDTDFIISLLIADQSTHPQALALAKKYQAEEVHMLRLIHYELATVLSRKHSQELALAILSALKKQHIHYLTLDNDEEVWQEFHAHKKKNISFFDCANLVTARRLDLKIASFDTFYPKVLRIA